MRPELMFTLSERRPAAGLHLLPASVLLHAGLALAMIVVPILTAESLPPTASVTRAFFAEPGLIAPPPPPPAPRAVATPRVRTEPAQPATPALTAPLETPAEVVPEETADLGVPGGEPGGVEGGMPGGVVGGIVGGLPDLPAPPSPIRVGGAVREPTKLRHVNPVYPDLAVKARVEGTVIVECVVSEQGRVSEVRVLRGMPLLNEAALEAVRQWVYTPTFLGGIPIPVIMTVTVRFHLQQG